MTTWHQPLSVRCKALGRWLDCNPGNGMVGMIPPHTSLYLCRSNVWIPSKRRRASILFVGNVLLLRTLLYVLLYLAPSILLTFSKTKIAPCLQILSGLHVSTTSVRFKNRFKQAVFELLLLQAIQQIFDQLHRILKAQNPWWNVQRWQRSSMIPLSNGQGLGTFGEFPVEASFWSPVGHSH